MGGRVVAAGGGILLHLGKDPGIGGGGAANHDGVAAGLRHHALGVFGRVDVAIADYGDAHGFLDRSDDVPVGLAGVALHARARMHRHSFHTDGFGKLGNIDGDDGVFVPAGAQLNGERNFYGSTHSVEDLLEQRHVAQQAGAAALHYFFGWAAPIYVAPVVPKIFDHARGFGHDFRVG